MKMKKTKLLIIGGSGQLGYDCIGLMSNKYEVFSFGSDELDITILESVVDKVKLIKPDYMLNCAAYTEVDNCEEHKNWSFLANTLGPMNLAFCAKNFGSKLIHISTDYVFDGHKQIPNKYDEGDRTNPLSYYGKCKLEAEKLIRSICKNHIIIRTSWLYGINGNNFPKTILKNAILNPSRELQVVNDQFGSPTSASRLATQIHDLIEMDCCGTFHASSENYCTWYDFASLFLDLMGITTKITPCTSESYPTKALRPMNSILENKALKNKGINNMIDWDYELESFVNTHKAKLLQQVHDLEEVIS